MNIAADPALVQARILTALQDPIFETLGLQFPYWKGKRLTLKEIEHALCEYSKYHRLENDPTSVGSRVKREYKSRSYLDIDKACLGCKDNKRDGIFCDMCNSFFCDSCKTSVKEEEEESWSCYRCTAFDNRRHFTKVIKLKSESQSISSR